VEHAEGHGDGSVTSHKSALMASVENLYQSLKSESALHGRLKGVLNFISVRP
jgi:hypothetical protein